jgi:cephalosporin hydroxylase
LFPFWDIAIAPVIRAANARRVVEIGALRGDTTMRLLDLLGPATRVDVIDPEPDFNPAEHERRFPGRYVFHRDISHNVLPHLDPVDVALIDGDHNWYTVHGELDMIRTTARGADAMLPVLFVHDVCWPYGRRDLYYEPARIPEEFRQPHRRAGMRPGRDTLLPTGGVNYIFENALVEGGPRNGVMTALDDFIAEHDRPLRRVVLPIYFGLAIVAEEERLISRPDLAEAFDRLEGAECRRELLELSESLRIQLMVEKRDLMARFDVESVGRTARRYLTMLRGALLNQHNLENEARLEYLISCQENGVPPEWTSLRDPAFHLRVGLRQLTQARHVGASPTTMPETLSFPYTAMGEVHLDHLQRCLETIQGGSVEGDLVECGVGRGGGAIFLRGFLEAHELLDRRVWAVDRFTSPAQLGPDANGMANQIADLNMVREGFARFGLLDDQVRFLQGPVAEALAGASIEKVALLRVDASLIGSPADVLEALYDKISLGGFVVIDGFTTPGCRQAVEEFRERRGIEEAIERVDERAVYWRKLGAAPRSSAPVAAPARGHVPLAPPLLESSCELSVIVVVHDMRREAQRTLHSLSPAYQQGIADLDYEVIVVENGSVEDQKLGAERVRTFGPQFRYLDLGEEATPSPAPALNRGVELARGEVIAVMVDGAHLLTPGVLRYGMLGIRGHEPAIVATQQWYVGPGQQAMTVREGYDRAYEDSLFERISWPLDGYRLFEIGSFIGDRDWFDGLWESNCVFVPRHLLEQNGCLDEGFSMPGGGFTNLDFYERIGATPGVNVVTILGEGSFHQIHGGTTTNQSDPDRLAALIPSYRVHYLQLRHRPHRWTGKPLHYVGSMTEAALRTRPRRKGAVGFMNTPAAPDSDGRPSRPVPLPEELQAEFTDAYWRSFRWQRTNWLGHPVAKSPADLLAYQELIVDAKPDWVIESPSDGGGRALFLASVCELTGRGQVLSISEHESADLPQHPRLTYLTGDPLSEKTIRRVRKRVGHPPNALVVFGLAGREWLLEAFALYSPLVPEGSGVVFEDTVMSNLSVWPGMGPGPAEAVREILRDDTSFARDPRMGQLAPSFNAGGYLRRVAEPQVRTGDRARRRATT